jgi:hypothetical protein
MHITPMLNGEMYITPMLNGEMYITPMLNGGNVHHTNVQW